METIKNNSDFIFLYDATMANPNGDPDQENKPRMDNDTHTNLVTDTRVKRFIRDYLIQQETDIFVSMEGESKVAADTKLKAVVARTIQNQDELNLAFQENEEAKKIYLAIIEKEKEPQKVVDALTNKDYKIKIKKDDKKEVEIKSPEIKKANYELLAYLVKQKFIDIRLFGSAFAVGGFTRAYTGPVQLNWGYSLNDVYLMDSSSIVTTMNDDSSTFGKDYRVYYSLLGFHGTINKNAALTTGLTDADLKTFRTTIWESIPALVTRTKINQYPKLYLEIIYNEGFNNGHFGDLRNLINCKPKNGDFKKVRKFNDLELDFSPLTTIIKENKGKAIKDVIVRTSPDLKITLE